MTNAQMTLIGAIEKRLLDQRDVAQMLASVAVVCRFGGAEASEYTDDILNGVRVVADRMADDLRTASEEMSALLRLLSAADECE